MREIKFRAWNKFKGEMFDPMPIVDFAIHKINAVTLMQFTGLKDSKGVEIFEGDIIRWNQFKLEIYVDEFHGYRFMCGKDLLTRAYAEGEILGNIYENPDLLKSAV